MTKEELEKEVEMHKWNNIFLEDCAVYDKKIAEEYTTLQERIEELDKENAEIKTKKIPQLERKIASIRGSHRVDLAKLNARIEQVERLKKENAELKADNDARKFAMAMSEKVEKQLREENAELKDEWQEQVQKATDEGYARTLQTIQLTKAKEIIKTFLGFAKAFGYSPSMDKFISEAEQFISEVEK